LKKPKNARFVLDEILHEHRKALPADIEDSEHFELFVSEQVLRAYKLENEEIASGVVAGGDDGQIDSIYLFVNGNLLQGDVAESDLAEYRKNIVLDLVIIQSKREESFTETAIQKMDDTIADIFDLGKSIDDLKKLYNADLISMIEQVRTTRRILSTRFPVLNVEVSYATKGDTNELGKKQRDRAASLKKRVLSASPTETHLNFAFLGARELIQIASKAPKTELVLKFTGPLLMAGGKGGYVCLAKLRDYFDFISENGEMLYHLFESNVRDYQRDTEVNKEIQGSLTHPTEEDFWWLNNGITIIAAKAQPSAESLTIDEPQIVNGLQTSQEIFNYFSGAPSTDDSRRVQIRVIESQPPERQDRIITATNRQNAMSPAQFHATEQIHRDIEKVFPSNGLFYDRRKNYWLNRDKPKSAVVGIRELTQDVQAIYLQRPDTSRARPGQAFAKQSPEVYGEIFSQGHSLKLYVVCVCLQKRVETFLRSLKLSRQVRNDIRFYVSMAVACFATNSARPGPAQIAEIDVAAIKEEVLQRAANSVRTIYESLGATEKVAKGTDLLAALRQHLQGLFVDQPAKP
jgi:AIPR protein